MEIKTRIITIKKKKRVALLFPYSVSVITLIKQVAECVWSVDRRYWHIPYRKDFLKKLNNDFRGKLIFSEEKVEKKFSPKSPYFPQEYINVLKQNNYSEPTIKTYKQHFQRFLNYYPNMEAKEISQEQIREYIIYLVEKKKYSESAQNNAINSIKFYYTHVLNSELDDYYAPRPRRAKIIPKVLNEKEVILILKQVTNIRDKCMIFLVYSAGLTPSEIVYLKPEHINSKSMKICITSPKGETDRFVVLSGKILNYLRTYFKRYNPKFWLFESHPRKQYSKRNIQKSFKEAVLKSGIFKPATLTILKNSFAVHLIEKGVDIRYIQQMLGHKHSKTTMKYLKVSKKDLKSITSPLDNLEI